MKKILYSIFTLSLLLPTMASAATFSFSPNTGTFTPGETFNVAVYANPGSGEEITVAKISVEFPTEKLNLISFSQAPGWMSLVTPGSDLIDNTAGKLIKTAGFPARLKKSKQFGTIVFKTKVEGTATVNVKGDSIFLDIANANKYVTSSGANFTIKAAPIKVSTPPATSKSTFKEAQKVTSPAPKTNEATIDEATTTNETATSTLAQTQTAATASANDKTNSKNLWYYLIATLALFAGVFAWRKWGKNLS